MERDKTLRLMNGVLLMIFGFLIIMSAVDTHGSHLQNSVNFKVACLVITVFATAGISIYSIDKPLGRVKTFFDLLLVVTIAILIWALNYVNEYRENGGTIPFGFDLLMYAGIGTSVAVLFYELKSPTEPQPPDSER
jgi:hypothetical protein